MWVPWLAQAEIKALNKAADAKYVDLEKSSAATLNSTKSDYEGQLAKLKEEYEAKIKDMEKQKQGKREDCGCLKKQQEAERLHLVSIILLRLERTLISLIKSLYLT